MLGERLRQVRLAAGLSLEGLAERLERPITRQALSRYETGASEPSPSRIADIAAALNIPASSFLSEPSTKINWVAYRKLKRLSKYRRDRITAVAGQRLEGEVKLRRMFHMGNRHDIPGPIDVQTFDDCEYAASAVRMRWDLGYSPVNSLVELAEHHGVAVVSWPEEWGFDGLSGWASQTPVIVLNETVPPDRLRLNIAHEVGHLVMKSTDDSKKDERFAFRFAASFLVPSEAARHELGTHRRELAIDELGLLKQRWGLSMQGWIRRARDLDIISDDVYRNMNITFRQKGWHRDEPYQYEADETPRLFRRLLHRALAEHVITPDDANRFDATFSPYSEYTSAPRNSLRDVAQRPPEARRHVLQGIADALRESELGIRIGTDGGYHN